MAYFAPYIDDAGVQEHKAKGQYKRLPPVQCGEAFIYAPLRTESERYSILCRLCLLQRPFAARCAL